MCVKYLWRFLVCSLVRMSNGWCMVNTCNYINPQVKLLSSFQYLFMFPLCYTVLITHKCSTIQVSFSSQACVLLGTRVHMCTHVCGLIVIMCELYTCLSTYGHGDSYPCVLFYKMVACTDSQACAKSTIWMQKISDVFVFAPSYITTV